MKINREIGATYRTGLSEPKKVGDPIAWRPQVWTDTDDPRMLRELRGTVIYVNEAHRYYTAEALVGGRPLRESFRF